MTLSEQLPFDSAPPPEAPIGEPADPFAAVRDAVEAIMMIEAESVLPERDQQGILFRGRLLMEAEAAYDMLTPQLEPRGFTPLFQTVGHQDVIIVLQGVITDIDQQTGGGPMMRLVRASGKSRWWLHLLLLILTVGTTTFSGAILYQTFPFVTVTDWLSAGLPFALTLLFILGVHEMGHYVAARYHKVKVTLPFFIPLPLVGLGTLGAVIFIRSPLTNRKQLFDVGISGPLAGLIVAVPLFLIGLSLRPVFGAPARVLFDIDVPPLLQIVGTLTTRSSIERTVLLNPVALAAWFGVLLTFMNLLPLGQFDGGHVSYALFGRLSWFIANLAFAVLVILGVQGLMGLGQWEGWLIWGVLALLSGLRHPPPQNDITPLDLKRKVLGWVTIGIFLLLVVPVPLAVNSLAGGSGPSQLPPPTIQVPDFPTPTPFRFDSN